MGGLWLRAPESAQRTHFAAGTRIYLWLSPINDDLISVDQRTIDKRMILLMTRLPQFARIGPPNRP